MQKVYLEKNQYYNLSWYFPLFNRNHYVKCWKWEYCPMFASYLQLVWGTLSSHFKWWSLYFKTSISPHIWGGDESMGDTRTQNVTHNEDINVITIFLDRNLKFECRQILEKNREGDPYLKTSFSTHLGEGLSPWGYQKKVGKLYLMMGELRFWYISTLLMIRMIY